MTKPSHQTQKTDAIHSAVRLARTSRPGTTTPFHQAQTTDAIHFAVRLARTSLPETTTLSHQARKIDAIHCPGCYCHPEIVVPARQILTAAVACPETSSPKYPRFGQSAKCKFLAMSGPAPTPKLLSPSCPSIPLVPSLSLGTAYGLPCAGVPPGVGTCGAAIVGVSHVDSPVLI